MKTAIRLGLAAMGLVLAACGKAPEPVEDIRPVRTLTVGASQTSAEHRYSGEVRARYESTLGFRVPGKLVSRKVDVGMQVKAGQLLAQLDPKDLVLSESAAQAQVAAARAQAEVAELDYRRVKELLAKGFISKAEYDRQETQLKATQAQAQAVVAQAAVQTNQTAYSRLLADSDGVVTAVLAEAGQVVAAGQPVIQIARRGEIEVAAAIPEDRVSSLSVGMPVTVSLWSQPGKSYAGRIRELSSAADPYARTYALRISVAEPPPEMKLRMTATVSIPLPGQPDLIHLPSSAMVTQDGKAGVWVVEPQSSSVRFKPVQFAGVEGNQVLVGAGLGAGEVVVTAGAAYLHAGQKVKLLAAPPALPTAPKPAAG
ncbi:efflux RND transporter periplasmic adaptor subunit [Stagnimonas aquatica]|nr:efflux RND transporter periplasmic adaptor subunit [Stagnimonas aquatica]